jgi:DNA-binding transcriptional regulator GbsR (MarR family)
MSSTNKEGKEKEKSDSKRILDKNINLGKKLLLSKMGLVKESTHTQEFIEKNNKFKQITKHYEEINKLGKDYTKSLNHFSLFEQQLGEEFSQYAQESKFKHSEKITDPWYDY